ncbi:MAG: hypothetical protein HWN65_04045 [Candidatus Helarchaeota archaeon]|nr:hypothetical protein [Candidatus Helarchaeota archaeon]
MERLTRNLYNLNEWALLRLFRVVTGLKLAYNPDLKKIHLITLDAVEDDILQMISGLIIDEFEIEIELLSEKIDYRKAIRGRFLNTSRMTRKLKKAIPQEKTSAIMVVTNHWLAPTGLLISRVLHTVFPILGITYLLDGICFVTTLNGHLPTDLIQFGTVHEVGHLLGLHGYPLTWLKKKKMS